MKLGEGISKQGRIAKNEFTRVKRRIQPKGPLTLHARVAHEVEDYGYE